jgi:tetratricopeptide (TPR) repeat protein
MPYEVIELRRLASAMRNGCEEHVIHASELAAEGRFTASARHREAAKRLAEGALSPASEDPFSLNDLAVALADLDEKRQALQLLRRARQLAPGDASILFNLAAVLWRKGRWREAASIAGTAHDLAPEDSGISVLLEKFTGTLALYTTGVLDLDGASTPLPSGKTTRAAGVTVPLHVFRMSLPHKRNGYTFRAHELLLGQQTMGLDPVAVTAPFFPAIDGYGPDSTDCIEGVAYHRLRAPDGCSPLSDQDFSFFLRGTHRHEIRHPLGPYLSHYARELIEFGARIQPDLLHSHSNHRNAIAARAAASALGLPHVYEVRGMWEDSAVARGVLERSSDKYRLEHAAEARCCEEADAVVTLAQTMKDDLVDRGIEAEKIFLVPNGVDPDRFAYISDRNMRAC